MRKNINKHVRTYDVRYDNIGPSEWMSQWVGESALSIPFLYTLVLNINNKKHCACDNIPAKTSFSSCARVCLRVTHVTLTNN